MMRRPILPPPVATATLLDESSDHRTGPAIDSSRGQCGVQAERRPRLTLVRTVALLIATASLILLAAACGGSPSSTSSGSSFNDGGKTNSHQVAFSRCMRSSGLTNYPDPNSSGVIPKESPQELGVTSSKLQSAQISCQHLLPNGGNGPNQAEVQQVKAQGLKFAQCMRTHGVALPDPGSDGRIPDPASVGLNQGSSSFQAANQACGKYRPPYMPSNAQYNAYAQTRAS
jgi:hypothetical protein